MHTYPNHAAPRGSSGIVSIIKNVHRVHFLVTPYLPTRSVSNVDFEKILMHHINYIFEKRTAAIDPLPPSVCCVLVLLCTLVKMVTILDDSLPSATSNTIAVIELK